MDVEQQIIKLIVTKCFSSCVSLRRSQGLKIVWETVQALQPKRIKTLKVIIIYIDYFFVWCTLINSLNAKLQSYRNQWIDLLCKSGIYMMATLAFNELSSKY